jgi:hypothetical protein
MVPGPSLHLVLGLVLLLAVVACAPTERETETPPPDETAALEEFQLQADQVCLGTRAELQLLRTELFERDEDIALPPEEALQPFERAAALLRTELTQLQELSPPDPFANDLEVWLAEVSPKRSSRSAGSVCSGSSVGCGRTPRYWRMPVPAGMSLPMMTFSFRPSSGSLLALDRGLGEHAGRLLEGGGRQPRVGRQRRLGDPHEDLAAVGRLAALVDDAAVLLGEALTVDQLPGQEGRCHPAR